jgi:hypothetical protein
MVAKLPDTGLGGCKAAGSLLFNKKPNTSQPLPRPQFICDKAAKICGASQDEAADGAAAEGAALPQQQRGRGHAQRRRFTSDSGLSAAAMSDADTEHDGADDGDEDADAEEGAAEEGGALEAPLQQWLAICVQLCSTHSALRTAQVELPAKDPRYIEAMNEASRAQEGCRRPWGQPAVTPALVWLVPCGKNPESSRIRIPTRANSHAHLCPCTLPRARSCCRPGRS